MSSRRLRLSITAVATAVVATAAVLAPLPASAATPAAGFTWAQYDPAGTDTRTNAHLNLEYVVVRNNTAKPLALAGWRVRDVANHTFVFPRGYVLKARASVVIHTGRGTNTAAHLYWNQAGYIWNNTGDTARLQTPANKLIDTCKYASVRNRVGVAC